MLLIADATTTSATIDTIALSMMSSKTIAIIAVTNKLLCCNFEVCSCGKRKYLWNLYELLAKFECGIRGRHSPVVMIASCVRRGRDPRQNDMRRSIWPFNHGGNKNMEKTYPTLNKHLPEMQGHLSQIFVLFV